MKNIYIRFVIISILTILFIGCSSNQPNKKVDKKLLLFNKTLNYQQAFIGHIEYIDKDGNIFYYRPNRKIEKGLLKIENGKVCFTYLNLNQSCKALKNSWEEILDKTEILDEVIVQNGDSANLVNRYNVQAENKRRKDEYNLKIELRKDKIKKAKKKKADRKRKNLIGKRVISYLNFKISSDDCLELPFVGTVTCHKVTYKMGIIGVVKGINSNNEYRIKIQNVKLASQSYVSPMYWKYKSRALKHIRYIKKKYYNDMMSLDNAKKY